MHFFFSFSEYLSDSEERFIQIGIRNLISNKQLDHIHNLKYDHAFGLVQAIRQIKI